jgi:hypothetical protein
LCATQFPSSTSAQPRPDAGTQSRPDFSGVWIAPAEPAVVPAASDPRAPSGGVGAPFRIGDMGSGWGSPVTVVQSGNRLTVEYPFFSAYDLQPPLKFTYALDGTESRNSVMMGRGLQEQRSRTGWTGSTLVITTQHTLANPADGRTITAEVRQSLTLQSPASLLIETTRAGVLGGSATTTRYVYTKR